MFDSHCHLTDLEEPIVAIEEAKLAGVSSMLSCGYDAESNAKVLELKARIPRLPIALGLHPWYADQPIEEVLALIEKHNPEVIGEAGLDLWGETPIQPIDRQVLVLEAQLSLARRLGKAVTLHSRKAIDLLLQALRRQPGVRGALHAYSGSWEQLRQFLDIGMYLGIGGAVTRLKATRVRRCAKEAPLSQIVIETDAPAIGMDIVEPPNVRPKHVARVAEALAQLRGITVEEVVERTDENAKRLFGIERLSLD
jgi:TatD DNase family protein